MEPTPPPAATNALPPRPGWWSRNWKWCIPTGCLTLLGLIAAFAACIVFFVFGLLKSTDVYQTALARAKANAEVQQALGTPIKEGWYLTGNTHVNGPSGSADISGPNGSGTIYAVATKSAGEWSYSQLEVEIAATKNRIPLEP